MSVWGCVGKLGAGYMRHLDLPLSRKMMKEGRNLPGDSGGAYGAASAFNKWQRGYRPGGQSTWKDVAARRGTVYGAGAVAGGIVGGMIERARRRRNNSANSLTPDQSVMMAHTAMNRYRRAGNY